MTLKFDPNASAADESGIFGLPYSEAESKLVYLPVPWEATTTFGGGTAEGPAAVLSASRQVDLFDFEVERPYLAGLYMRPISEKVIKLNKKTKALVEKVREMEDAAGAKLVNSLTQELNDWVYGESRSILESGKILALLGGDHSTPLGAFKAVGEKHGDFGILHIDAHSDTRMAYEGFRDSHASIMHNALTQVSPLKKLVQVGIRDFCEQEWDFCQSQGSRVKIVFDQELARQKQEGLEFSKVSETIVSQLPEKVWISFDVDGLEPHFCPNTGTPVPGGLDYYEATRLISEVVRAGKRIIGFDLNEVGKEPWDANVGARLLYKMTAWCLVSQGLVRGRE